MLVTVWILFIVFGLIGLLFLRKLIIDSLNLLDLFLFLFSIIIASVGAGIIFGGLQLPFKF